MKFDKKLIIGAIAAALTAGISFLGVSLGWPEALTAGLVGAVAWLAAWLNGRNNTTA